MAPPHTYTPAARGDSTDEEDRPFISAELSEKKVSLLGTSTFNRVMGFVNVVLALLLVLSLSVLAVSLTHDRENAAVVSLPYSPARHVLQPVTKKFRPSLTFQTDDPDVADPAWNDIQGPVMGYVGLEEDASMKLFDQQGRPTIMSPWDDKKWLYAPSMYHQLHCLDILRRSFHRERYFPNIVLCHADVDMIYWWNRNYTTFNEHGEPYQSEWYKSLNFYERFENAEFFWDIDHTCNRLEPLEEWVAEHRFFPLGFEAPSKTLQRSAIRHRTMSPPHRIQSSSPSPPGKTRRGSHDDALRWNPITRLALYLCGAAELIVGFGDAVGSMPWIRLVESVICGRHVNNNGATTTTVMEESGIRRPPSFNYKMLLGVLLVGGRGGGPGTAEARCKSDGVQAEMSEL
ncbi:MAG: hypothetical protein Q9208_004165 [Pyrenodesmia sp. 3 TL-2023]